MPPTRIFRFVSHLIVEFISTQRWGKKVTIYGEILESGELLYKEVFAMPSVHEKEMIVKAYEAEVAQFFHVYFERCLAAKTGKDMQEAEEAFRDSMHRGKEILKRAISMVR